MKVSVVSQITARSLLRESGVGAGGQKIQTMLIDECVKEMDPYVPMDTGTTKNTRVIEPDGVTYMGPHAQYIYHGMLMVDPVYGKGCFYDPETGRVWSRPGVRKVLTDKPLSFHGAPTRGPYWDVRMWADKGSDICRRLARKVGGKTL